MNKYLVISYDDDEQQWFYDRVLAENAEEATSFILRVRDYCIAADALRPEDLGAMSYTLKNRSEGDIRTAMAELEEQRNPNETPEDDADGLTGGS